MRVLSVQVDQQVSDRFELRGADQNAVYTADVSAAYRQLAVQHEFVAVVKLMFGKICFHRRILCKQERRFDCGFVGAGANAFAACALAEHKADRLDEDRFACARFAGQYRKARIESNVGLIYQSNIRNL